MVKRVPLAQLTMEEVRKFFIEKTNHNPSDSTFRALRAIAVTLEDMVYGTIDNKIHLSSLDPGSGKTVTITQFVKVLISQSMTNRELRNKGVLICLSRLDEIKTMVKEMDLDNEHFACLTSDATINGLGLGIINAQNARVLFTTQQMLEKRLNGEAYVDAEEFYFRGSPRPVRIWDESYLPGQTVVISELDIRQLSALAGKLGQLDLDKALHDVSVEILTADAGSVIAIPELEGFLGIDRHSFLELISQHNDGNESLSRLMQTMLDLSGRSVSVGNDGGKRGGSKAVTFRET